jgi:hypothetical protein
MEGEGMRGRLYLEIQGNEVVRVDKYGRWELRI